MEKTKKTKNKKVQTHGQGLGRGLAGDMGLNCLFFLVFPWFFAVWPKPQEHKKKKFRPMGKVWAIHTQTKKPKKQKTKKPKNQKTKKTKKQKTKKPKNQKTKKPKNQKNQKDKTQHSASDPLPLGCAILFFLVFGFLVSWFFGFLVCVWIAQTLPMGLNFLFFFCFFLCSRGFGQTAKNHGKTKKTKKPRLHTPRGGGQMQSVGSCLFVFFVFFCFLFFWFFGFSVWIAIADVPSRDCQALSVVALEARSIHYSTAMFAMT